LFRRCKPHDTAEPLPGRSKVHELSAPESGPLAQGLLEVILNQAYLDRLPENDGGIVTIHLESWQIDVLAMFGIIIKTDPASTEATMSGSGPEYRPERQSTAGLSDSQPDDISKECSATKRRLVPSDERG